MSDTPHWDNSGAKGWRTPSGILRWEGFHTHDGLYFKRMDGGVVEVLVTESAKAGAPVAHRFVLDANTWASVVASVSAQGESGETFATALAAHNEGADPATESAQPEEERR